MSRTDRAVGRPVGPGVERPLRWALVVFALLAVSTFLQSDYLAAGVGQVVVLLAYLGLRLLPLPYARTQQWWCLSVVLLAATALGVVLGPDSFTALLSYGIGLVVLHGAHEDVRNIALSLLAGAMAGLLVLVSGGAAFGLVTLTPAWCLAAVTAAAVLRDRSAPGVLRLTPAGHHATDPGHPTPGGPGQLTTPARRPRPDRVLLTALAPVLLLALAAWLLLPVPAGPHAGSAGGNGSWGSSSRSVRPYLDGDLDLSVRGTLPKVPVLQVPADSPQLWRANVLADYDGRTWTPAPDTSRQWWPADSARTTVTAVPQAAFPGYLLAPGAPVSVDPAGVRVDGYLTRVRAEPYTVTVTGYSSLRNSGPGIPGVGPDDPDDPRWTALPDTVTPRTRALAHELAGDATDPALAGIRIGAHLRSDRYRYDLDAPVAPAGADSVDYFLFESRSGFCEHYASAEVVLLRSLGYPARVATGFGYGTSTPGGDRMLRTDNAHAWAEVWVPDRGWVTVDPTPRADPAGFSLAAFVSEHRAWFGVAALVAAPLVLAAVWWRRRRSARAGAAGPVPHLTRDLLPAAVQRLRSAIAADGVDPGQTLTDLAVVVPASAPALEVARRHLYAPHAVPTTEQLAATEQLDACTGRVLAAAAQRGETRA